VVVILKILRIAAEKAVVVQRKEKNSKDAFKK
jgi:hypothetical protein